MKSYAQRCPLARALDLVGERWTLLVIRELLLGPRRYTDLLDGLPGIGTNILAARLSDLQGTGLVRKRTLPPPTAVTVYELTESGRKLAPSVGALSAWGEQHGAPASAKQAVRPAWILLGLPRRGAKLDSGRSCELWIGRDVFELIGVEGGIEVRTGPAHAPDARVTLALDVFYRLVSGRVTAKAVRPRAEIDGDRGTGHQVLIALSGLVGEVKSPA